MSLWPFWRPGGMPPPLGIWKLASQQLLRGLHPAPALPWDIRGGGIYDAFSGWTFGTVLIFCFVFRK